MFKAFDDSDALFYCCLFLVFIMVFIFGLAIVYQIKNYNERSEKEVALINNMEMICSEKGGDNISERGNVYEYISRGLYGSKSKHRQFEGMGVYDCFKIGKEDKILGTYFIKDGKVEER